MPEANYAEALSPIEFKPTNWPRIILAAVLGFGLLAGAAYAGYCYGTCQPKLTEESVVSKRELPENLLVYTRCFRPVRQRYPDSCDLYIAQVGDPRTEDKVYTFDFPPYDEEKDKEYPQKTFKVELVGVVDKYAIYKKWDEVDGGNVVKLGSVDLATGKAGVIHTFTETEGLDRVVYVDSVNKKIYYATTLSPFIHEGGEIKQHDLSTGGSKVVAGTNILDKPYVVLFASEHQLYLSPIPGVMQKFVWDKILNLEDGVLIDVASPRVSPTVSPDGSKVVYTETERLADNRMVARLKLANADGSEEQDLYSKKSQEGDIYAPSFHDIAFDHSGIFVTAKLETVHLNVGETESFVWNLKPYLRYTFGPHKIVPGAEEFRFINNYEVSYWYEPKIIRSTYGRGPAVLYERDGAWFVRESIFSFFSPDYPIDLYDRGKALVVDAEDVFLLP
jgi:hypothetical protein